VGPQEGVVGTGEPLRLLAIGDSIVAGVGVATLAEAMPGRLAHALAGRLGRQVRWVARGVSGFDAADVRRRLVPDLAERDFDVVFVSVGVNDVTRIRTTAAWMRDLPGLVEDLRRNSPEALIVVSGLPPLDGFPLLPQPLRAVFALRARTFDAIAEHALGRLPGVLFTPNRFEPRPEFFAPDGYHPSGESCRIWAEAVAAAVGERLDPRN
jgi:lysophospholipase L1-like esterase